MNLFAQALVSSLAVGSAYALVALGYSIIYSTMKMGHFAQGEFYMFGAFVGFSLFVEWKMPIIIAIVGAGIVTSILMLLLERLTYRPLYNRPMMALLITTMGMQYIVQEIARLIWGSEVHRFPSAFGDSAFKVSLFGTEIFLVPQNLWITGICAALMIALAFFMKKTKTGVAMSAVSMNRRAASLMGVRLSTIIAATYILAAFLAATAGVLMSPIYSVGYTMGGNIGNKAMTAAVMGGFGSLPGAMLGGLLLGVIETLGSVYISSAYKDAFSFVLLLIILFWRPQGILGQAKITKV